MTIRALIWAGDGTPSGRCPRASAAHLPAADSGPRAGRRAACRLSPSHLLSSLMTRAVRVVSLLPPPFQSSISLITSSPRTARRRRPRRAGGRPVRRGAAGWVLLREARPCCPPGVPPGDRCCCCGAGQRSGGFVCARWWCSFVRLTIYLFMHWGCVSAVRVRLVEQCRLSRCGCTDVPWV